MHDHSVVSPKPGVMVASAVGVSRRSVLKGAAAGAIAALGVGGSHGVGAQVSRYVPLGRTGMQISDVSFGSSGLTDANVVRLALDRGVNYFDCAETYTGGDAERALGAVLPAVRDRVYITTKHKIYPGHAPKQMMRRLESSLRRLRTDYVDVHFNHAVNDVARLSNEHWHEFVARAKADGKIRFAGVSGHGSKLVEVLDYVLANDVADVVLAAHNFGQDPDFMARLQSRFSYVALQEALPRRLAQAREQGIGVVAMKVLYGARLNDMRAYEAQGATFAQAALSWVLNGPYADAAVISMDGVQHVEEYLPASGRRFVAETDFPLLERYAAMQYGKYCYHGCDRCAASCPLHMPIAEVLRTRMYALDYGRLSLAKGDYATLGRAAAACLGCNGEPCRDACAYGLPIAAYMREAQRLLA